MSGWLTSTNCVSIWSRRTHRVQGRRRDSVTQSPDREARFDRLFDLHHDAVQVYCLRRLPTDDVNDAVAEVFLVAWRRIDEAPNGRERYRRGCSGLARDQSGAAFREPGGPRCTINPQREGSRDPAAQDLGRDVEWRHRRRSRNQHPRRRHADQQISQTTGQGLQAAAASPVAPTKSPFRRGRR